jgi:hypothetical protein
MNSLFALALLQQDTSSTPAVSPIGAGMGIGMTILWLAIVLLMVASMWKLFVKAGKPGWAAIVPIYNLVVLLEIAGKPLWWFILFLIPVVNFIVLIILAIAVARKFGKGTGFALGMVFLSPIFYPILAFGDSTYNPQG